MKNSVVLSGRVGLILLAAALVVWGTMQFVDTNTTNRFAPDGRNTSVQTSASGGDSAGVGEVQATERREFRGERYGPRNQAWGTRLTFGLFGLVKNSVIIGVVVLVVVGIERFFTRKAARVVV